VLKKGFKEIISITNREFLAELGSKFPLLGDLLIIGFSIIILVYLYQFSFLTGFIGTPIVLAVAVWSLLLVNNLYKYWKAK
jgi:hypothetical protein